MNDDNTVLGLSRRSRLTADVSFLMLKGAGYAAIFVVAIWLLVVIVAGLGRLLPAESRETPDPLNRGAELMLPAPDPASGLTADLAAHLA